MNRYIGFGFIVLFFPLLYFLFQLIVDEIKQTTHLQHTIQSSIQLSTPAPNEPVQMVDRNGELFAEEYIEWREPLSLETIPAFIQQLFITSEDQGFYDHRGFDVAAIFRAFAVNAATDDVQQGGSTITQQVVRMRFLTTDKTYERKLTELFYASALEKEFSKENILEMYLNEMYFGNQVYGIGAAASYYFNRPLTELNKAEMAFIAAIPNNPSLYDPLKHFEQTKKRQERLLTTLENKGFLSIAEVDQLKQFPITLTIKSKMNKHPDYRTYVLAELEQLIASQEGWLQTFKQEQDPQKKEALQLHIKQKTAEVLAKGPVIHTALDQTKQMHDQAAIHRWLPSKAMQAGAVIIQNDSRKIVSLQGGKNYQKGDFNRAFQAYRQPGSAFKPLLIYAPLFEGGKYSEKTPVNGGPICIGRYCPQNIGGAVYGTVTIRDAFRYSHNTVAVRLLQRMGIEEAFQSIAPFPFEEITERDWQYSAALGGFEKGVTPLEMAQAYTSFIDGSFLPAHAIVKVTDKEGQLLYQWNDEPKTVWSPSTVTLTRNLLRDVVNNGTGKGITASTNYTGAKTGTTDRYHDLWVVGLNDQYTAALWMGQDRPASVKKWSDQKTHLRLFSQLLSDEYKEERSP